MKTSIYFLMSLLVVALSSSGASLLYGQCPTSPPNMNIYCGDGIDISADTTFVRYNLTRMSCTPYTITGTNAFPTACDDCVTGQINIGFPFNFYGNTYTTAVIQSNGILGFGNFTYTGYMPYAIPANGEPDNYIAGFYADIDIRNGGTITYQTIGTAPNRKFVVSYNNVAPFGATRSGSASFQIVLNEDNSFHVIISYITADWYASTSDSYGTSGAENSSGGVAFIVEDRNYTTSMLGIVPGNKDCTHFNPQPCSFLGWYQGATRVTTSGRLVRTATTNESFTPKWKCQSDTCVGNPVNITVGYRPVEEVAQCQNDASKPLKVLESCPVSFVGASTTIPQNTVFNTGSLTTSDPKYTRVGTGSTCSIYSTSANYYYDTYYFVPSATGSYTFNMCHVGSTFDGHAALFVDNFDPANPCATSANFVAADDDSGSCSSQPSITANLTAGRVYILVTTTFGMNNVGNYQWTYSGVAGATIATGTVTTPQLNWYTSPTATTPIATGETFNPVGVPGSGIANTATSGTWTFYVACGTNTVCRTPVTYTIQAPPQADMTVEICTGATASTVTPSITCGNASPIIAPSTIFNANSLTTSSPTFVRSNSTTSCNLTAGNTHYYHAYVFRVTEAGSYTFQNCTPSIDAYGMLFAGGFNSANPCGSTFIVGNDDSSPRGCSADPSFTATLTPGVDYYLITTSYSDGQTASFDWIYTTTTANGRLVDQSEAIRWYDSYTSNTSIHIGPSFNPTTVSGSGITSTATAGNYTYYYRCEPTQLCKSKLNYNIIQAPTAFTTVTGPTGSICPNTTVSLSASGGTTPSGTTVRWYTGSNGSGTLVGTGSNITVTPAATTTYYVRKESACLNTSDLNVPVTLKQFVYATNGTTTTDYCTDNDGWHHFYTGNQIILSVKGDISTMGTVSATIEVNTSPYQNNPSITLPSCEPRPEEKQFEMRRRWNINYTGTLAPPYQVRFYHLGSEKSEIINLANYFIASNPTCGYTYKFSYPNGFHWFKNNIHNHTPLDFVDTTHLVGSTPGSAGGINYEVLSGITSFSGGSGSVILIPNPLLDNSILSFTGIYKPEWKANVLRWNLDTQREVAFFELYHSKDGASNWERLAVIERQEDLDYLFNHQHPSAEINYYQLKVHLFTGADYTSQVIAIQTPKSESNFVVYPNPTNNSVKYEVTLATSDKLEVSLINVLGQTIYTAAHTFDAGRQQIEVPMNALSSGTYLLRVLHSDSQIIHTVPVVKAE